jgi:hypothetical protein
VVVPGRVWMLVGDEVAHGGQVSFRS